MKKIFFQIIAILMLVGFTTSCSDQLDTVQHGAMTIDNFYKTDKDAISASATIYHSLLGWIGEERTMLDFLSDDCYSGGATHTDNMNANSLNEYTFDSEHQYIKTAFTNLYKTVYDCNILIEHVAGETPVQKQMVAEAKTLRAMTYIYLIMQWGTPPLVDHTLSSTEYAQPNGDPAKLWAFVEQDLNEAINSGALLSKDDVEHQRSDRRVTKEFAEALLGKAYLFQKKYQEAASELDKVINSGKYALWTGEYRDMFKAANELNCEFIFQVNKINDPQGMEFTYFDTYPQLLCWRTDQMESVPFQAPGMGWGFFPPRKELYDAFVEEEGTNGYRLNNCILTYDQVKAMGAHVVKSTFTDAYFNWKNIYTADDMVGMSTHRDYLMMRYAEVLLLAAEANVMCGNQQKADLYYNMIRSRAKLPSKKNVTLEDIKKEKRLELCWEQCRWIDLVRWGDAPKYLAKQGEDYPMLGADDKVTFYKNDNSAYGFKEGKNELLPFPAAEIRLNTNLKQNPQW